MTNDISYDVVHNVVVAASLLDCCFTINRSKFSRVWIEPHVGLNSMSLEQTLFYLFRR